MLPVMSCPSETIHYHISRGPAPSNPITLLHLSQSVGCIVYNECCGHQVHVLYEIPLVSSALRVKVTNIFTKSGVRIAYNLIPTGQYDE